MFPSAGLRQLTPAAQIEIPLNFLTGYYEEGVYFDELRLISK